MNNKLRLPLTKWTNFKKDSDTTNVYQVYELIKGNTLKSATESIQQKFLKGKIADAENEKKLLIAITFCAAYLANRTADNIGEYNGFIILDYDALDPLRLMEVKARAVAMETSILVYVSPSGQGVKILVAVNSTIELHEQAFNKVSDLYDAELGVKSDRATKDVSRLCFLCHDKEAYFNPNAIIFEVETKIIASGDKSFEIDLQNAIAYTNRKWEFKDDNRNNYIFRLACNCNRYGFPKDDVLAYLVKHFVRPDFTEKEITTAVESPYKNYSTDFGSWKKLKGGYSNINSHNVTATESVSNNSQVALIAKCNALAECQQQNYDLESQLQIFKNYLGKISNENDKETFITGCFAGLLLSNKFIAGK
jgi:hypothetical protein